MRSCIAYAIACDGADIRTIEGFDSDPLMQALRSAFTRHHALQCGYCTPGMLITAYDITRRLPGADEARVREELSGNLCRCTGYVGIVESVRSVLATDPARDAELPGGTGKPSPRLHGANRQWAAPSAVLSAPPPESNARTEVQKSMIRAPESPPPLDKSSSARRVTAGRHVARDTQKEDRASATPGIHPSPGTPALPDSGLANSIGSEHELTLAIAADSLWHILKDIDTVVRCLPGASLTSPPNADPLSLCMIVAIGPMRARFEGTAGIEFNDLRRTATINGSGHDPRTRSTTHGRIELVLRPSDAGGSILTLRLHYVLKGPLAQFGRGAIVDAVVEQILEQFAANLVSAAEGGQVDSLPPPGGLGIAAVALWRRLQRWLTGGDR